MAGAWRVFSATHKKSGKSVSVFVFDRKILENASSGFGSARGGASAQRRMYDEVVERLKKEANSLARLRHPSVLELAEPVEETRSGGLMFATEPILATVGGLLSDKDEDEGMGKRGYKTQGVAAAAGVELDELEIQKGLLQVAKGLEFLHESAGLVHANLTPEAIYVNAKSDWKIAGLGFCGPPDGGSGGAAPSTGKPIALSEMLYHDPGLPPSLQLDMDFTSPDFVLDQNVSTAADMFSLGLLIIALYNSPHISPLRTHNNAGTYKKIFGSSSTVPTQNNSFLSTKPLPRQLQSDVLPKLITRRPAQRMTARDLQQSALFDNILVSALRFLEELPAKTANEKSQFMKGLPRILDQFPRSVLEKKVLVALLEETKDRELLAIILANAFKIMKLLPGGQRTFSDKIIPKLKQVYSSGLKNAAGERDSSKEAGLVVVLDNLSLIADNCTSKVFKDDVLPVYALGLESSTSSVVDKTLTNLGVVLPLLDFSTIKNELFPVVAAVFAKTSSLMIKVRGLEALTVLCGGDADNTPIDAIKSNGILDKYTVQGKIIPLVKAMKTKEPAVMMAALVLFRSVAAICDYDFLATNVLPVLWSFSLGPLLNLQQFQRYMELIKSLSGRIEKEQIRKLSELATNAQEPMNNVRSTDLMSTDTNDPLASGIGGDDFERLILGKKIAPYAAAETTRPSTQISSRPAQFSWQSSSANVLQPSPASSRAITPDHTVHTLSAMQSMQPSQSWSAIQPMHPTQQPLNMGIGLSQPLQPSKIPTPASNPWISPNSLNPSINGPWGAASQPSQRAVQAGIDWSRANQTQISPLHSTSFVQTPSAIQPNVFSITAPPSSNTIRPPAQQQQQKKSGLDAYESLI